MQALVVAGSTEMVCWSAQPCVTVRPPPYHRPTTALRAPRARRRHAAPPELYPELHPSSPAPGPPLSRRATRAPSELSSAARVQPLDY